MLVLFYDSPGNTSGNPSGAQKINTNYICSEEGRRPFVANGKIRFTPDKVASANEDVTLDYVKEFKIKLINTAYNVSLPGSYGVTLTQALILTDSYNGDAFLIKGHCQGERLSDVAVITKYGYPGKLFKHLYD